MGKVQRDYTKALEQKKRQDNEARYGAGLTEALAEGTQALIARKGRSTKSGKEIRAENGEPKKTERPAVTDRDRTRGHKRHVLRKTAKNGDAIAEVAQHLGWGTAIRAVDPKRGNRAIRALRV
jgi:hypothetical protein